MLQITAIYAGILGLIAIGLAAGSGLLRAKTGVSLGDGGDKQQLLAVRRHGNFCEWVPLALILLGILELNEVTPTALHAMGGGLVFARIAHPLGLNADDASGAGRAIGAGLTALIVLVAAVWSLVTGLT